MNKTQLSDVVAKKHLDGNRTLAKVVLDTILEEIVNAVSSGDRVALVGFGAFERLHRPARVARNPETDDSIEIPATAVPKFKPAAGFKRAVEEKSIDG